MIGWLIFGMYAIGFVPSWWIISGALAWGMKFDRDPVPDTGDWAPAFFFGACVAVIWPLSLPVTYAISKGVSSRLLYTPPMYREQMQKELIRQRDDRIRELEREAGIGQLERKPAQQRGMSDIDAFARSVWTQGGTIDEIPLADHPPTPGGLQPSRSYDVQSVWMAGRSQGGPWSIRRRL